jgi:hypothetical protein
VRPMSREVLAREAAAKAAAQDLPPGPCAGHSLLWTVLERAHRQARTAEEAKDVVDAARREFCGRCEALMRCGVLAEIQQYTGLAAGAAYETGVRQPPTWIAPKASRARKAAS